MHERSSVHPIANNGLTWFIRGFVLRLIRMPELQHSERVSVFCPDLTEWRDFVVLHGAGPGWKSA